VVRVRDGETCGRRGDAGVSVSSLWTLRDWLNVVEAAGELSKALGERVDTADVLRLGIDGHLALSLYLPYRIQVNGERINDESPDRSKRARTIEGVCDIPIMGRAKAEIEYQCQLALGNSVPKETPIGATVEQDGYSCKLPPDPGETETFPEMESEFPQGSVLCVRREVLDAFIRAHAPKASTTPEPNPDRPVGARERRTLLLIIGALAKELGIDVTKASKAGDAISRMVELTGHSISTNAIAGHFRTLRTILDDESDDSTAEETDN
jgi:hypothetical protein